MLIVEFFPRLFLLNADYAENEGLSLQEKSKIAIDKYHKEIIKYHKKENTQPPMVCECSSYYIIFWKNLPKTNIADNTEDMLFNMLCKSLGSPEEPSYADIYIRDKDVLADHSVARFIKRLCLLHKHYNQSPKFLDNTTDNLLSPDFKIDNLESETIKELALELYKSWLKYHTVITFLENIYTSITNDNINFEEKGFIYYYFEWQRGNISSDTACKELGNISRRTFYRYIAEFEQHPYFAEYCKLFPDLIDKPKKGPLSVDLEAFYKEVFPIFDGKKIDISELGYINIDDICKKYSLASAIDVYRTFLAVKKKLKIK